MSPGPLSLNLNRRADQLGEAMTVATFTLPIPPSVNAAYRNTKRGRAKTDAAKDWHGNAMWRLDRQINQQFVDPSIVVLGMERPTSDSDVDNRIKLMLDLLVDSKTLLDDRLVTGLAVSWLPKNSGLCHGMVIPSQTLDFTFRASQNGASGAWQLSAPSQTAEEPSWL